MGVLSLGQMSLRANPPPPMQVHQQRLEQSTATKLGPREMLLRANLLHPERMCPGAGGYQLPLRGFARNSFIGLSCWRVELPSFCLSVQSRFARTSLKFLQIHSA